MAVSKDISDELAEWVKSFGPAPAPSLHHDAPEDLLPRSPLTSAEGYSAPGPSSMTPRPLVLSERRYEPEENFVYPACPECGDSHDPSKPCPPMHGGPVTMPPVPKDLRGAAQHTAFPVDPSYWEEETSPDMAGFRDGEPGKWESLYHGTSAENLPSILDQGIRPWNELGRHNWEDDDRDWHTPRFDHTYLTADRAHAYRIAPGDRAQRPVVEVDPAHLDPQHINPDEDSMSRWKAEDDSDEADDRLRDTWNQNYDNLGEAADDLAWGDDPDETANVLRDDAATSIGYRGTIPPQAIRAIHTYDPSIGGLEGWTKQPNPGYRPASPVLAKTANEWCPVCFKLPLNNVGKCEMCGYQIPYDGNEWEDTVDTHHTAPGIVQTPVPLGPAHHGSLSTSQLDGSGGPDLVTQARTTKLPQPAATDRAASSHNQQQPVAHGAHGSDLGAQDADDGPWSVLLDEQQAEAEEDNDGKRQPDSEHVVHTLQSSVLRRVARICPSCGGDTPGVGFCPSCQRFNITTIDNVTPSHVPDAWGGDPLERLYERPSGLRWDDRRNSSANEEYGLAERLGPAAGGMAHRDPVVANLDPRDRIGMSGPWTEAHEITDRDILDGDELHLTHTQQSTARTSGWLDKLVPESCAVCGKRANGTLALTNGQKLPACGPQHANEMANDLKRYVPSLRQAMAERSGFPELDAAIDEFMQTHEEVEHYRDPQNAWGQCETSAQELAAFLKQRGFKAYAPADELRAFPGYENAQDSKEIGAGDFSYPEHAMVEVYGLYGPNNVNTVTIDFTASQYGFTEFPKVHPGPPSGPQAPHTAQAEPVWTPHWGGELVLPRSRSAPVTLSDGRTVEWTEVEGGLGVLVSEPDKIRRVPWDEHWGNSQVSSTNQPIGPERLTLHSPAQYEDDTPPHVAAALDRLFSRTAPWETEELAPRAGPDISETQSSHVGKFAHRGVVPPHALSRYEPPSSPDSVHSPAQHTAAAIEPHIVSHGGDSYGGEYHGGYTALHPETREPMGYVDYGYHRLNGPPEFHIKHIEVAPQYRRQGVAQALLRQLGQDDPSATIDPGMMTEDGIKLYQALRPADTDLTKAGSGPLPLDSPSVTKPGIPGHALDQHDMQPGRGVAASGPHVGGIQFSDDELQQLVDRYHAGETFEQLALDSYVSIGTMRRLLSPLVQARPPGMRPGTEKLHNRNTPPPSFTSDPSIFEPYGENGRPRRINMLGAHMVEPIDQWQRYDMESPDEWTTHTSASDLHSQPEPVTKPLASPMPLDSSPLNTEPPLARVRTTQAGPEGHNGVQSRVQEPSPGSEPQWSSEDPEPYLRFTQPRAEHVAHPPHAVKHVRHMVGDPSPQKGGNPALSSEDIFTMGPLSGSTTSGSLIEPGAGSPPGPGGVSKISRVGGTTIPQYQRQMAELEAKLGPSQMAVHHQWDDGWTVRHPQGSERQQRKDIKRVGTLMRNCWQSGFAGGAPYVLHDPHGVPRVAWNLSPAHAANPGRFTSPSIDLYQPVFRTDLHRPLGHNNSEPSPEQWERLKQWAALGADDITGERKPVLQWHPGGEENGGYHLAEPVAPELPGGTQGDPDWSESLATGALSGLPSAGTPVYSAEYGVPNQMVSRRLEPGEERDRDRAEDHEAGRRQSSDRGHAQRGRGSQGGRGQAHESATPDLAPPGSPFEDSPYEAGDEEPHLASESPWEPEDDGPISGQAPMKSWHLTDRHDFSLDPEYHPENNTTLGGDWHEPGLFVSGEGGPERWFNGYNYKRPFVAEIEHPPVEDLGGYGGERFLPASQFPHSQVTRVLPYDAWADEHFYDKPYTGPDMRSLSPDEAWAHKDAMNQRIRTQHPEMLRSVCPTCASDYVSPGNPCPKCGHETDWDGNFYSATRESMMSESSLTGDQRLDTLIDQYRREFWNNAKSVSPEEVEGMCTEYAHELVSFLTQNGVAAEVKYVNHPSELGYTDRTRVPDPDEGHAVVVAAGHIIDFSAAQYGYSEFPKIQRHESMVHESEDYWMQHRPPRPSDDVGAPLHALDQMVPEDIYTHPHYYIGHEPYDRESWEVAASVRGRPDAMVTIHRATPAKVINPGDWVTLSKSYAEHHAMHPDDPAQDMPVVSKQVPARHLWWDANSINEYGYHPDEPEQSIPGHEGMIREGGKLHDFLMSPKSRPDLQTPEGQAFLKHLGDHYWSEKTDPLMPWLAREWKKGRITHSPEAAHRDGAALRMVGDDVHRALTRGNLDHWADFYGSNHPLRRGLGDIMQHDAPSFNERVKDWDEQMRLEAEQARAQDAGDVVHRLPNDWTVRKLRAEDLDDEGATMGHCVGGSGYEQAVDSGDTQIYSLRDPQHQPHATMEIEPHKYWDVDEAMRQNPVLQGAPEDLKQAIRNEHEAAEAGRPSPGHGLPGANIPALYQQLLSRPYYGQDVNLGPENGKIVQIQGKGNNVPKPEYQAMIKHWLSTIPEDQRPTWKDEPETIWNIDQITNPEAHDEDYGGYGPHGDYGVAVPQRETDYNGVVQSIHDRTQPSRDNFHGLPVEPNDLEALYKHALERKEIPQLAKAVGQYSENVAMPDRNDVTENNFDYLGPYPGEEWEPDEHETQEDWQAAYDGYRYNENELRGGHVPSQITDGLYGYLTPHWDPQSRSYVNHKPSYDGSLGETVPPGTFSHVPEDHQHRETDLYSATDYLEDNRYRRRATSRFRGRVPGWVRRLAGRE